MVAPAKPTPTTRNLDFTKEAPLDCVIFHFRIIKKLCNNLYCLQNLQAKKISELPYGYRELKIDYIVECSLAPEQINRVSWMRVEGNRKKETHDRADSMPLP